ncbi:MAG: hypothetical protein NVSMB27_26940 [Ktedonobacteraceae bacterium]
MGVDNSLIARLEQGTRNPPRKTAFYRRLRELPSISDADIADLLRTDNAPAWLTPDRHLSEPAEDTSAASTTISAGGFHITYSAAADDDVAEPGELEALQNLIRAKLEHTVRDYLRHSVVIKQEIEGVLRNNLESSKLQTRIEEQLTREDFKSRKTLRGVSSRGS